MALIKIFNALALCNWSCKSRSRSSPCFPKNTARASPFIASPLFSPTSILLLNILSVAYLNMNIVFSIGVSPTFTTYVTV